MNLEQKFHQDMLDVYKTVGEELGYWANRYLQAVRRHGGLSWAKKMLEPMKSGEMHTGLRTLLDAGRPDLTVESLVLNEKYLDLFEKEELEEAAKRLARFPKTSKVSSDSNFPDELPHEEVYYEGAVKKVTVNQFERNPNARKACIERQGTVCKVCGIDFEMAYGEIGKGFIHIHHTKPLATKRETYELKVKDLVPVCPNCHAMLHTQYPPLSVTQLRDIMSKLESTPQ